MILVICCHTGKPDWGNGPKGNGRIFKISYQQKEVPQPVMAWAASETQTIVAFDREIDVDAWSDLPTRAKIESGRYVAAGDHIESMRPGYQVVQMQQRQPKHQLAMEAVRIGEDRRSLIIETKARRDAVNYAVHTTKNSKGPQLALAHDLTGVSATWTGGGKREPMDRLVAAPGSDRGERPDEIEPCARYALAFTECQWHLAPACPA